MTDPTAPGSPLPEWLLSLLAAAVDGSLWLTVGVVMVALLAAAYGVVLLLRLIGGASNTTRSDADTDVDSDVLRDLREAGDLREAPAPRDRPGSAGSDDPHETPPTD